MKFRKKPVVIEAIQIHDLSTAKEEGCCACPDVAGIHIHTLEGSHLLTIGDWLITGIKGERYFCKPDIFDATYEPVAPAAPKAPERGAGLTCECGHIRSAHAWTRGGTVRGACCGHECGCAAFRPVREPNREAGGDE